MRQKDKDEMPTASSFFREKTVDDLNLALENPDSIHLTRAIAVVDYVPEPYAVFPDSKNSTTPLAHCRFRRLSVRQFVSRERHRQISI